MAEKMLDGLRWAPRRASRLGCLKGCLDYLGLNVSDAWLFGATGHAFIINVHDVVCPSGPTAWNTEALRAAQEAEAAGLEALAKIRDELQRST